MTWPLNSLDPCTKKKVNLTLDLFLIWIQRYFSKHSVPCLSCQNVNHSLTYGQISAPEGLISAFIQVKSSFWLFSICVLCEERKVTVKTDVSGHAELISKHTNALPLNCPTSFTICTSNLHFKPLFLFIAVSQYQDSPLNPNQESQKTPEKHIFKIKSYLSLTANY